MTDTAEDDSINDESIEPPKQQATSWHRALLTYLQTQEADLWKWFSSHKARSESAEAVRLELLKTGYRLDREAASDVYELADTVAEKMGLQSSVTLYQAQHPSGLNAHLAWLPNEAHVVLHGPIRETLSESELVALLAHELAHHELYTIDEGVYLVMEQILSAMLTDEAADDSHDRTWRSHRLYTELYCDRRAAEVTGNIEDCVGMLVKIETGLKDVSPAAYLAQADEVLSDAQQKTKGSDGVTHPEMFIRAKALELWQTDPDTVDNALQNLVEGPLELGQLDFLRQQQIQQLTRNFLQSVLSPHWLQTDLMLGYAKRFFNDFEWRTTETTPSGASLAQPLAECDEQLRNYFCYLMLDIVTYDPDLEEGPLAAAFLFAKETGLIDSFRTLAEKELKFSKRALQKVEADAEKIVRQAKQESAASSSV